MSLCSDWRAVETKSSGSEFQHRLGRASPLGTFSYNLGRKSFGQLAAVREPDDLRIFQNSFEASNKEELLLEQGAAC